MLRKLLLSTAIAAVSFNFAIAADPAEEQQFVAVPEWRFSIGGIYLYRDAGNDTVLFRDGGLPGSPEISSVRDLSSLDSWGGVVGLSGDLNSFGIDLRAMLTAPAQAKWSVTGFAPPSGGISFGTLDPLGFGFFVGGTLFDLSTKRETTFASLEANFGSSTLNPVRFFAGARAFGIDDDLDLSITTPAFPTLSNTPSIDISNRLYGGQIGVEFKLENLSASPIDITFSGKIGVLRNQAQADLNVATTGFGVNYTDSDSDTSWTRMAELGINGTWRVTENFDIEIGYNLIYFDSLATSTATLATSVLNPSNPLAFNVTYENALYHGGTIKAIWRF